MFKVKVGPQISGAEERCDQDFLIMVKSANFAVKFTERGTSTVKAGGGSGEKRSGNGKRTAAFLGWGKNNSKPDFWGLRFCTLTDVNRRG